MSPVKRISLKNIFNKKIMLDLTQKKMKYTFVNHRVDNLSLYIYI